MDLRSSEKSNAYGRASYGDNADEKRASVSKTDREVNRATRTLNQGLPPTDRELSFKFIKFDRNKTNYKPQHFNGFDSLSHDFISNQMVVFTSFHSVITNEPDFLKLTYLFAC